MELKQARSGTLSLFDDYAFCLYTGSMKRELEYKAIVITHEMIVVMRDSPKVGRGWYRSKIENSTMFEMFLVR
jgi:hypothetical protein